MTNGVNAVGDSGIWRQLAPLRVLIATLAIQILISSLFILGFCNTFKISKWLLAVHLPLAALLYVLAVIGPGLLLLSVAIRRRRITRYFLGLVPGAVCVSLVILYVVDFACYRWLGAHVNYRQAYVLLVNLMAGRQLVPLSPRAYFWLAVVVLALLGTFVALGPKLFRGVEALLLPEYEISLFHQRARAFRSLIVIGVLLCGYATFLYVLRQRAAYSETLSNDPLISFARNSMGLHDKNYASYVAKLKDEEQHCRLDYAAPKIFDAKNIIIIVGDSLRSDHMSLYGYKRPTTPFLDDLFKSGVLRRVTFATSLCSETRCGVLAALNSKTEKRQIPENFNLQELLKTLGYDTFFILSGNHNLTDLREYYGSGMSLYFDGTSSKTYDVNDDRLIFEALNLVPARQAKPAFFLFHLMSPHLLGIKQDEFRVYQPSAVPNDWEPLLNGQLDQESVINNYDNGVLQTDAVIKKIFAALEEKQYLRNSIVVILGDHGESLGERGEYGHVLHLYQEYISIPLLIYDPDPVKYANLDFATQIDIAPTILERMKLPVPSCWEGNSLLNPNVRSFSTHQTTLRNPCFAVINRTEKTIYKYIYCTTGKTEELYDLTADPTERNNLIGIADSSLVESLRAELRRVRAN